MWFLVLHRERHCKQINCMAAMDSHCYISMSEWEKHPSTHAFIHPSYFQSALPLALCWDWLTNVSFMQLFIFLVSNSYLVCKACPLVMTPDCCGTKVKSLNEAEVKSQFSPCVVQCPMLHMTTEPFDTTHILNCSAEVSLRSLSQMILQWYNVLLVWLFWLIHATVQSRWKDH